MDKQKLELIKKMYCHSSKLIFLTDVDFEILWSSDDNIQALFVNNNMKAYFPVADDLTDFDDMIIPITVNSVNYTMTILSIYEEEEVCGYLARLVTVNEIFKHLINKDYSDYQIEFFSYIRTQISGIISTATLLQNSMEQKDMYEELKILNQQVNYCYRILSSIINPSEISKYSYNMHNIVKINASKFLSEIVSYTGSLLRGTEIEVKFSCAEDIYIDVDPDRLVVVLMNLIINSIQNNIEEKKVINVSLKLTNNNAILTISDNGNGISTDKLSKIFNKSFEILNFSEDDNKKYGYGFQVLNLFCRVFNSKMYLSTKENFGTTISLRIPISTSQDYPEYLESKTVDYLMNRFSNIYISLSQVTTINYI